MNTDEFSPDDLAELAIAQVNGEPLDERLAALADQARKNPELHTELEAYKRTARAVRNIVTVKPTAQPEDSPLDDDLLASYVDGVLDADTAQFVERELARSPYWLNQYAELKLCLAETAPHESLPEVVIRLARRGLALLARPATGFTQTSLEAVPVLGPDTEDKVLVWTQTWAEHAARFTVTHRGADAVNVDIALRHREQPVPRFKVRLFMDGALVEAKTAADTGTVQITQLVPAVYDIAFEAGEHALTTRLVIQ